MLPDSIELVVVTPQRQLLRERVLEAVLPGAAGSLGVLPGHAPLMTELGVGELTYRSATGNRSEALVIASGFAEVLSDRVTVLAETAEMAAEIDLARAEAAKARAEKHLAAGDANIDWDRASVALQRAVIRIQVARKHRGVPVNAP
jgi:F-type H+-transporting ATPase subunit epsilon